MYGKILLNFFNFLRFELNNFYNIKWNKYNKGEWDSIHKIVKKK